MNYLQLYRLIRYNASLKDERHPMFEKNRFMKFLILFMWLYYAAILILFGVTLPLGMKDTYNGVAAFHVLDGFVPYLLIVDFWLRFILQETPVQQVHPYSLLPIRRSFLMNVYLFRTGFSYGNTYWGFLLVPFGMIAVLPLLGWFSLVGWLIGWWLLFIANGFLYLITRTLCLQNLVWVLLPAALNGGLLALMLVPDQNPLDMPFTKMMYGFALGNFLPYLIILLLIGVLFWICYHQQMHMVYNEVGKKEEIEIKNTNQLNFLSRFGILGEFLKLEMKLRLRNKQVRTSFLIALGCMVMLSMLLNFTEAYDNEFMTNFICLYDYAVLGMMTLITIMCFEGNYIDGLMSRRESIYSLLKAKYYISSSLLLIPIILVSPSIMIGKISIWMNLGYLFFTAGVIYPIMFQLAVYNRNTIPLNQKLTAKQASTAQNIISIAILFVPIGIEKICVIILGDIWGFVLLMSIGIIGICTHKLWLQNIYHRFMSRRHYIMEGMRASR